MGQESRVVLLPRSLDARGLLPPLLGWYSSPLKAHQVRANELPRLARRLNGSRVLSPLAPLRPELSIHRQTVRSPFSKSVFC